jgi:galactokinase
MARDTLWRLMHSRADPRNDLVDRTLDLFVRQSGRRPEWAWFVPGRIEIFGKHTDYAGGRSLITAVSRGFAVVAAPRDDELVLVTDIATGQRIDIHPGDRERRYHGWSNYVAVVARRLARNFPGAPSGIDIGFASNLPRAAGVSSSSALVVGMATALIRSGGLEERPEWRAAIHTRLDLAGYLGAVESGLTFGALAGTSGVGIHGGSEDHTAILMSQEGMVSAYAYVPVRHLVTEAMPEAWRFIIVNSGVHAAKAGRARDQYNRASNATRALVHIGTGLTPEPVDTLADLLATVPDAAASLRERLSALPDTIEGAALGRRLDHFIREDGRVLPAARAFRDRNRGALDELSRASQEDADVLLGNQVEETRQLAMFAREAGAFAASSFGAGFGGSVWALADTDDAEDVLDRWKQQYVSAFPAHRNVEGFVTSAGAGLSEWDL